MECRRRTRRVDDWERDPGAGGKGGKRGKGERGFLRERLSAIAQKREPHPGDGSRRVRWCQLQRCPMVVGRVVRWWSFALFEGGGVWEVCGLGQAGGCEGWSVAGVRGVTGSVFSAMMVFDQILPRRVGSLLLSITNSRRRRYHTGICAGSGRPSPGGGGPLGWQVVARAGHGRETMCASRVAGVRGGEDAPVGVPARFLGVLGGVPSTPSRVC